MDGKVISANLHQENTEDTCRVSSDKLDPEADSDCHFRERALERQL